MKYLYLLPLFLALSCALADNQMLQNSIFGEMYNPPTITISPDSTTTINTNEIDTIIKVSSGGGIGTITINMGGTNTTIDANKATNYEVTNKIKLASSMIAPISFPISVSATALKTGSSDLKTYSYLFNNFLTLGEVSNSQALSELSVNVTDLTRYVNGIKSGGTASYIIEWYVDSKTNPSKMVNARSDLFTGTWSDSTYREDFTTSVQVMEHTVTKLPSSIYTKYYFNSLPITDSATLATINSGMFIELVTKSAQSRSVPTGGNALSSWSSFTWPVETNFIRFNGNTLYVITINEPTPGTVEFLDNPSAVTNPFFTYTNR